MTTRIFGQDAALATLRSALRDGRMHHAWIFAGPRGVGKFTTAIELAKSLLDPQCDPESLGSGAAPANESQRLVENESHPDLHVIRKELAAYSSDAAVRNRKLIRIPLNVLREFMIGGEVGQKILDGPAYRTSSLGHGKVFIIDEAELLAREAQNTMLKTLEEPPTDTYIILVTAHPERLYTTILSRCQQVRFHRLDDQAMPQWADDALRELPATRRKWIVKFAQGSPGLALQAVQFEFDQWQQSLEPMFDALAGGAFPPTMGAALGELVDGYAGQWVERHDNASKEAANKHGFSVMLSLLGLHVRSELQRAVEAGDAVATQRLAIVIDLLREAEWQVQANVNYKLVLENLVAQWASAMRGEIAMV